MLGRATPVCGALALAACSPPLQTEDRAQLDGAFSDGFDLDVLAYDWDEGRAEQIEARLGAAAGEVIALPLLLPNPQSFIRNGQARTVVKRALETRGLPEHSVAGSTALLFGVGWEIANQAALEPWQYTALLTQSAAMMRSSYRTAGDRRRQMEADLRYGLAALWLEEARIRRDDPVEMAALSEAVHRYMLTQGSDLRGQVVTEDGFADRPEAKATP